MTSLFVCCFSSWNSSLSVLQTKFPQSFVNLKNMSIIKGALICSCWFRKSQRGQKVVGKQLLAGTNLIFWTLSMGADTGAVGNRLHSPRDMGMNGYGPEYSTNMVFDKQMITGLFQTSSLSHSRTPQPYFILLLTTLDCLLSQSLPLDWNFNKHVFPLWESFSGL